MSTRPINLSKPDRTIHVGVVLMKGETEILDVAPVDFLHSFSHSFMKDWDENLIDPNLKVQTTDFAFHWINEKGDPAKLTAGITLQPTDNFSTAPPLDIVIMGAHAINYQPSEAELAYVRKVYEECAAFISICGGVQVPILAGLLKGKTATAPRPLLPMAKQMAPDTHWLEKRWHRDGKMWTSGALLNGLDLMNAFVTEFWGGDGTLADHNLKLGHCPARDVNYADAVSAL